MISPCRLLLVLAACLLPAFTSGLRAQSQLVFTSLYSFKNGTDGAFPAAAVIQGSDGNFYGTDGGASDLTQTPGAVFQLVRHGSSSTVSSLYSGASGNAGAYSTAALVQGGDGNFYGTFTDLFGNTDGGTVFQLTPGQSPVVLHTFTGSGTDGAYPYAPLIQDGSGNFYGTTAYGGSNGNGTVFELTPKLVDGHKQYDFATLYSFSAYTNPSELTNTEGALPIAALVLDSEGNLYGTTNEGGSSGYGTIFKLTPPQIKGQVFYSCTALHTFSGGGTDGAHPSASLLRGSDGNLYGTTSGLDIYENVSGTGTIFTITPSGSGFATLHTFSGVDMNHMNSDGAYPVAGLIQGSDGNLYGTAAGGGVDGTGTVFEIGW